MAITRHALSAVFIFSLGLSGLGLSSVGAQEFPARQIRLVVPFPAGGTVDTTARIVGQKVSEAAGQTIIVDNRAGAAGNIGTDNAAKAAPDGYTILQTINGLSLGASIYKKLPFDARKDLAPVAQISSAPLLIVASAKSQIKSLKELIAVAKQKPGSLNYGSTGVGISLHLTMEMLRLAAGIDIVHIPYRGDAPLLNALVAGDVEIACVPFATTLPHIQAGTLRPLAVTTPQRAALLPDVQTVAELGFPSFESTSWQGWFVPAGTPKEVVLKLNGLVRKALAAPEVADRFKTLGLVPVGSSPEEFGVMFNEDVARFAKVVKDINLPLQD